MRAPEPLGGGSSLARLVGELAAHGEVPAVLTSTGEIATYTALAAATRRAAERLVAAGVRSGHAVACAVKEPAGQLLAALAVLAAGAVLVPCDPRAPLAVNRRAAERVGASITIDGARFTDGELEIHDGARAPRAHDPRAAMLLTTSGSSGEAKVVVLGLEGLARNVEAILTYLPVAAHPRTGVVVPLSYSYGLVGQAMVTLRAGGTLVLLGDVAFPVQQVELLRRLGVQGLSSVPSSLRRMAAAVLDAGEPLPLGYVGSAGAPLDAETVARIERAFPGAVLFNQYGLTEASPRVTALSNAERPFAAGSVGRALPGIEIVAVAGDGARLPPGEEGELAVRGPSTMLGYLDDEAATRRVLSEDGVLRTGDAGRVDVEGYVFVSGRRDGVVKIGGERVGVDEVALQLRRAPGVRDACVLAAPHAELGAVLWAFVEGDGAALEGAVRRYALAELPPTKRPARVVVLAELPRTPNGKVALADLRSRTIAASSEEKE